MSMSETSAEVVKRYLREALASEKTIQVAFEALDGKTVAAPSRQIVFNCGELSRRHQEQLKNRLASLAVSSSDSKSLFARVFESRGGARETEHQALHQTLQALIEPFAATHSAIAIYEALAIMAAAGGDSDTAGLARLLQGGHQTVAEQLSTAIEVQCVSSLSMP